ncbi:hypothetical protein LTR91_000141 [Friedmanniomyces endolithicus]|uniref:Calcineurin-like phosphoesterase domain-containing protein n=1 Tax=Friedmanniomyces endolithicus TaxID=329885 RepID=A0AAN6L1S5_9PEZI|nr:hypothetical protein LTS01_000525 [Friedmanniomyces endolithicus]KAK1016123.1 hypothetical protein LTR91_000141 [Friedmanniomyces endolithicus]KAK1054519.1 hypothetical protein LTS16_000162 [Friedmanniomyces endolithicus]
MHLHHVALQQHRRLAHRYPFLRRLSIVTTHLTLLWFYALYWGERTTSAKHIDACAWDKWEKWPAGATPHHLVLIADPQLVDPHTYPGRPWPLSSLTETYTDLYMGRNYRRINLKLDPDSIVFLGDLFDGGREWATSKAIPLKAHQKKLLEGIGIRSKDGQTRKGAEAEDDEKAETGGDEVVILSGNREPETPAKRSMDSYNKALSMPHDHHIEKKDHLLTPDGRDLKAFVHGENGRWSAWGQRQWETDYARFVRIFFDTDQLYPHNRRQLFAAYSIAADEVSIENGARNITEQQYATSGGKQRRVLASLPGNHDIGLGMGVQLPVRDRFQLLFGETDRIDVIGNHTFVSVDTPSLSAFDQFLPEGGETQPAKAAELEHIWQPTSRFLENVRLPASKVVSDALHQYYPMGNNARGHNHSVEDAYDPDHQPTLSDRAEETLLAKPDLPVILLTHVPLYREPDTDCGNFRERGRAIRVAAGYQYQNVVAQSLSNSLINHVSAAGPIAHVFSGDDHDYCDVTHRYNLKLAGQTGDDGGTKGSILRNVKEITVKSFSWAMGVRRPGFQLVSLWNPVDEQGNTLGTPLPTVQSHLCLLPDQLSIFLDYALVLGVTLVVLLLRAVAVGLRYRLDADDEETPDGLGTMPDLPRYKPKANGAANGFAIPLSNGSASKGRHRASSTSLSPNHNSNVNLGVQRSYNARTRSVSPALGAYPPNESVYGGTNSQEHSSGPLVDKAGYYPQVRWMNPADEDSDEESHVGDLDGMDDDSQAKWKRRRRPPGKARKTAREFVLSLVIVGLPAGTCLEPSRKLAD